MGYSRIKSFAKINLALNVTGKNSRLHKIESIVGFVSLYDPILIKEIDLLSKKENNLSFENLLKLSMNYLEKDSSNLAM